MSKAPQTALERYKARRAGIPVDEPPAPVAQAVPEVRRPARPWLRLTVLGTAVAVLAVAILAARPGGPPEVELAYEVDLAAAPQGSLAIAVDAVGRLPRRLNLAFPEGVFGDVRNGVTPHSPEAEVVDEAGRDRRLLAVERTADGWEVDTAGARHVRFVYRVDVARTRGSEEDIRRYISTPVNGGLRAAGYEIFLAPTDTRVTDVTVSLRNPGDLPVLVPWPSLVRGPAPAGGPAPDSLTAAHLGAGQGYLPAATGDEPAPPAPTPPAPAPAAAPEPSSLAFHPRDLQDLSNALLVCGDIRTTGIQVRDTVIQFATDRRWRFPDRDVLDLVWRIARTQVGFFGSAPASRITVLLAANEVTAAKGFDAYGVHTGSSILVLVDPDVTWGELEDRAASVISHEMFHGWLGEAIPQSDPATLWFTEGATSWFAARMLTAAGVWTPDHARNVLDTRLERDYRDNPLLGSMSVADAAAAVMADADRVRFAYAGGVAACAALDRWLGEQSGLDHPLDQVLRRLYETRDGSDLSRASLEEAVYEVTGVDCATWLDAFVYGKTALPPSDRLL